MVAKFVRRQIKFSFSEVIIVALEASKFKMAESRNIKDTERYLCLHVL